MWTKRNYFIWFEILSEKGKRFRFPISLYALRALLESFFELIHILSYLVPTIVINQEKDKKLTAKQIRDLIDVIDRMVLLLEYEHHLDLVDIETKNAVVKIVLR